MSASPTDPRYPIGPFSPVAPSDEVRRRAIEQIALLPGHLRDAVAGLTEAQLDTPYRDGGWTVRQVVHHVGDSHMQAFSRMKLALTEKRPTITPYDEKAFAALADMRLPVNVSLALLDAIHARWAALYRSLTPEQFRREFLHPEYPEPQTLDRQLQMYDWHSRHHVAHITELRRRQGW
jgi:hypothetical protein